MHKAQKLYQYGVQALWAALFLLLPFTSSPQVARIAGGTMVATPSGLILFALMVVWFLPMIFKGIRIPSYSLMLIFFVLFSIISVISGYWKGIPPFKGVNILKENIEGLITLLMGVLFFFIPYTRLEKQNDPETYQWTFRLITYAGFIIFAKSILDFAVWRIFNTYPYWFENLHKMLVTGPLFQERVSGFAYEPSWLANQLNLLFIPYWLASVISRHSAFRKKLWIFQVEDFCLVLAIFVLVFTISRLGYLSFVMMVGIVFLAGTISGAKWLRHKMAARLKINEKKTLLPTILTLLIGVMIVLIYAGVFFGAAFALNYLDSRNANIFDVLSFRDFDFFRYARDLGFGARVSYWIAAWNNFTEHPFLGVGLGNSGFFFPQNLPGSAWGLEEVRRYMFQENILLNTKSLWFRLVSETGIIGFSLFITFALAIFLNVLSLFWSKQRQKRMMGWMGVFVFSAIIFEQLSLDSFALPYFWISFSIVAASRNLPE